MNTKTIVFPTDFSHCSDAALQYATSLARESGGTLIIVHAQEPPIAYGEGGMYYGHLEPDRAELSRMLQEIVPTAPDVPCEHRLLVGGRTAADQVAQFAKDVDDDLSLMGTHGRTGIRRALLGSVAEAILRRAHCPVLVIKQAINQPAAVA